MALHLLGALASHALSASSAIGGTGVGPWVALMFSIAVAGMAIIYVRTKPAATGP